MTDEILDQMAFTLDVLERDARLLDMTLLTQILSMAAVELAEARRKDRFTDHRPARSRPIENAPSVIGSWRWDLKHDRITFDPNVARLVGVARDVASNGVPLAILIDAVHALDKDLVAGTFARAASHDEPLHFIFRIKAQDGPTKRIFAVGRAVFENDHAVSLPGTFIDVTEDALEDVCGDGSDIADVRSQRSGRSGSAKAWIS